MMQILYMGGVKMMVTKYEMQRSELLINHFWRYMWFVYSKQIDCFAQVSVFFQELEMADTGRWHTFLFTFVLSTSVSEIFFFHSI